MTISWLSAIEVGHETRNGASQCYQCESNIFAQMVRLLGSTALLHGYWRCTMNNEVWWSACYLLHIYLYVTYDDIHICVCSDGWYTWIISTYTYLVVCSCSYSSEVAIGTYSLSQSCLAVVISLPARPNQFFKTSGWAHPSRGRLHSIWCVFVCMDSRKPIKNQHLSMNFMYWSMFDKRHMLSNSKIQLLFQTTWIDVHILSAPSHHQWAYSLWKLFARLLRIL